MTGSRYPTANDREAAKRAGAELAHPADKHEDPLAAQIADQIDKPPVKKARLKNIGGSESDNFNIALAEATKATAWIANEADRAAAVSTVSHGLAAVAPRDELEGMLGAQLLATHQASMECFRRAMLDGQTVEGRAMNLKHGAKASTTFATLLDALDRHRGRIPQRVIVEHRHVHFHEKGPAPVTQIEPGAPGAEIKNQRQPHEQRAIGHASEPPVWSEEQEREAVRLSRDEGANSLPASRRNELRRSKRDR